MGHLQGVGEAGAKKIAFMVQKNLGFINQSPKRSGVHDAIAVPLKGVARGRIRFQVAPSARMSGVTGGQKFDMTNHLQSKRLGGSCEAK